MKCADSMNAELKKPESTPSFTTHQHTPSALKPQQLDQLNQLPPVEIQGTLEQKRELQSAGKKAHVRSWKTYYTGKKLIRWLIFQS
jgi:spectrin beta